MRAEHLQLRVLMRALVMWGSIAPTQEWVLAHLPSMLQVRRCLARTQCSAVASLLCWCTCVCVCVWVGGWWWWWGSPCLVQLGPTSNLVIGSQGPVDRLMARAARAGPPAPGTIDYEAITQVRRSICQEGSRRPKGSQCNPAFGLPLALKSPWAVPASHSRHTVLAWQAPAWQWGCGLRALPMLAGRRCSAISCCTS